MGAALALVVMMVRPSNLGSLSLPIADNVVNHRPPIASEAAHPVAKVSSAPEIDNLAAGADSPVAAVSYTSSGESPWAGRVERAGGNPVLLLPTDRPLRLATLRLVPGQIVKGAGGGWLGGGQG